MRAGSTGAVSTVPEYARSGLSANPSAILPTCWRVATWPRSNRLRISSSASGRPKICSSSITASSANFFVWKSIQDMPSQATSNFSAVGFMTPVSVTTVMRVPLKYARALSFRQVMAKKIQGFC